MGTWIVGAFIAVIVGLAVRKVYKDRKSGQSCGCSGCSGCSGCPKPEDSGNGDG